MKYVITTILTIMFFALSCDKEDGNDVFGDKTIRGRLGYIDEYAANSIVRPLAKRLVKIAYSPSDKLNFLYIDTTDSEGYFNFTNLADKDYDIFFQDTVGGSRYGAFVTIRPPKDTLSLLATNDQLTQNGIFVKVTLQGQGVSKANVCLYNNKAAYDADTAFACANVVKTLTTDDAGGRVEYNLLPGEYYLRSSIKIGNDTYRGVQTVTVQPNGIVSAPVQLQKVTAQNTLEVLVLDNFNTPVNNATVCLFTSRAVFVTDSTCSNVAASATTNSQGKATFFNLNTAYYYARARIVLGSTIIKGTDSVNIPGPGNFTKTILIK